MEDFPKKVTIFGVGLIGGSLSLALKRAFPEIRIAGVDKPDVLERARCLKIIDAVGAVYDRPGGPRSASATARSLNTSPPLQQDLVVLATPVGEILKLLDQFGSNQTVVIDVGSTK